MYRWYTNGLLDCIIIITIVINNKIYCLYFIRLIQLTVGKRYFDFYLKDLHEMSK